MFKSKNKPIGFIILLIILLLQYPQTKGQKRDSVVLRTERISLKSLNSLSGDYGMRFIENDSILIFTSRRKPVNLPGSIIDIPDENVYWVKFDPSDKDSLEPLYFGELNGVANNAVAGISASGKRLYLYSPRNGGDLVYTDIDSVLSRPQPLRGLINSLFRETSVTFLPGDTICFFTSSRNSDGESTVKDIFKARWDPMQGWQEIQYMSVLNSDADEDFLYYEPGENTLYFASNRSGGYGGYDIYRAELDENGQPGVPKLMDTLVNSEGNDVGYEKFGELVFFSTDREGELDLFMLSKKKEIIEIHDEKPPLKEFVIQELTFGINMTFNKDHLEELKKLAGLIKEYQGLHIMIVGHSDSITGDPITNNLLSMERAVNAAQVLLREGADPLRIRIMAAGETCPVAVCPHGSPEEKRKAASLNRRIEFIVLEQDESAFVKIEKIRYRKTDEDNIIVLSNKVTF